MDIVREVANQDSASVVVVSRHREANEVGALRPLLEAGFQEIVCQPIDHDTVVQVLAIAGASNVSSEILDLGSNLLNLELICEIVRRSGSAHINELRDEISLWEQYVSVIQSRESGQHDPFGHAFIQEAVILAHDGLQGLDRTFGLTSSLTLSQRRLISSGVIVVVSGLKHRFQHEQFQDYLYARDATQRSLMPSDVFDEIERLHAVNVLAWMRNIYKKSGVPEYESFLEELLSG
jgi:hypothetical protein